jgi:hypothetical protein
MMALNNEFLEAGFTSGIILSPRVLTPQQAENHAQEIRNKGGSVLFDPQFYVPRTAHERILEFPYWQGLGFDTDTFDGQNAGDFCRRVIDYERQLVDNEIILPGAYTNTGDERWRSWQATFADVGATHCPDLTRYSTLAIGPDVVKNRQVFDMVLDEAVNFPVAGFYVLLKPPQGQFLVSDEDYLYAALDGLLSLREAEKQIIVGYANHQAILYAAVGVESIASGNFRNVRCFDPVIFDQQEPDERQRAVWYFDGGSLSEFRIQTIQLAYRRGLRNSFGPTCRYCAPLLEAADPSTVNWTEREAFRHCLFEMNRQWTTFSSIAVGQRWTRVLEMLREAQGRLLRLSEQGVILGDRSFAPAMEPSLAALEALRIDRRVSLEALAE